MYLGGVGLLDDPVEEVGDVLASFGQHANGDHVEHLYGLVEPQIEPLEIHNPEEDAPHH